MGHAAWNGQDDRLKERLFGLTNGEGNHGEDAKEYWWALDATPTHSWAQYLYRYPQAAFPYDALVEENARRGPDAPEFQLADTGVLQESRFFDIVTTHVHVTFAEYFDGDTGRGCGASHQTGWTALVAHLICARPLS